MWLQGLYNFAALSTALGNAFRKKGSKTHSYMSEPLRITPLTEDEKEIKAEKERQKAIDYFTNLQKKWESAKCRVPSASKEAAHEHRTG